MNSVLKSAAAILALSVFTFGIASAIVPQDSLKDNRFPDQGISSQVLSDIDKGLYKLRPIEPGLGFNEQIEGKVLEGSSLLEGSVLEGKYTI